VEVLLLCFFLFCIGKCETCCCECHANLLEAS
jgi:hypothetical protein